jgi:hypothetical protein
MKGSAVKTIKCFGSSAIGAALGAGIFFAITDPRGFEVGAVLASMVIFGLVFGLISALVHSRRAPTILSCFLSAVASVLLIVGAVAGLSERYHMVVTAAADWLTPIAATFACSVLMSLGGWLGLRIAAE